MLRLLFTLIAFSFSQNHQGTSFSNLKPQGDCEKEISYNYYTLCYSKDHKQASWTFHFLSQESIKGPQSRINAYKGDDSLADPVRSYDYRYSGFDRGHLVPAADMKLNRLAMTDTFYMTNMSPQRSGFNSGIWRVLESHVRRQVLHLGDAYIITAPILLSEAYYPKIQSGVSIPYYYYKIAYYPEASYIEAYLIPNESQKGVPLSAFLLSVDELEELTNYDFYADLEDKLEDELEALNSANF